MSQLTQFLLNHQLSLSWEDLVDNLIFLRDIHPMNMQSSLAREPETYREVISDVHNKEWLQAMQNEMNPLHENNTFELVKLPKGMRALKNKWVFKLKTEEHGSQPRYKARLVVKGFN